MQKRRLVLVVDRDGANGSCIAQAFSRRPEYACVQLKSATEALAAVALAPLPGTVVAQALPDLILLDLATDKAGSTGLLRRLRESETTRHIPVVALACGSVATEREEAYLLGVTSFFLKPAFPEGLSRMAEAVAHYWSFCEMPDSGTKLAGSLRR